MAGLFTQQFWYVWAAVLGVALFFPARRLIWVLLVRRAQKAGADSETERLRLRRRAGVTAALLCFVFAVAYVSHIFSQSP